MNITKYLNLVFKPTEYSTSTIKITKVKEEIREEKIENCRKTIVDQNILQTKNENLSVFKVARIITTETEEIKIKE
ncbi:DUF2922 family protein [Clostridium botulinum]|nr:DUF2922 family protein [Clostridium botulinum]